MLTGLGLYFILLSAFFFGFLAFRRYLEFKETVALVEKGLVRPERMPGDGKSSDGKNTLRWGVVIAAVGLALCLGLLSEGFGSWMLFGLIPLFFGLSLVLVYVLTREDQPASSEAEE